MTARSRRLRLLTRDDICWLFFTSGTTGKPKAAMLTHGQLGFVINNHLADLVPGITHEDASIVVAPLTHGAGVHQMLMVARGAATILPAAANFDAGEIWSLIEQWRVCTMFTVPTILKMMVEAPQRADYDTSCLSHIVYAGAPMYRSDQITALEALGPVLVQYFGLGEVTGTITQLPTYEHSVGADMRVGTCGFARTGMQVEIQGPEGQPMAPGGNR